MDYANMYFDFTNFESEPIIDQFPNLNVPLYESDAENEVEDASENVSDNFNFWNSSETISSSFEIQYSNENIVWNDPISSPEPTHPHALLLKFMESEPVKVKPRTITNPVRIEKKGEVKSTPGISKWEVRRTSGSVSAPCEIERPPFSYPQLCAYALLNSPDKVPISDVYSFILHHFRFYRYTPLKWRPSIRHCLSITPFFKSSGRNGRFHELVNVKEAKDCVLRSDPIIEDYKKKDRRGEEFYDRMLRGEIGLPRPLFYHVVGLQFPCFAGPENSALFYHLLSIKHIPSKFEPLFREYCWQEHSGCEPKHRYESIVFTIRYASKAENLTSYGAGIGGGLRGERMTEEEIHAFHDNVEEYFQLQQEHLMKKIDTWSTPALVHVRRNVIDGGNKVPFEIPRRGEHLPPGSLYRTPEFGPVMDPRDISLYT
ncbi:unnamed protein product [Caenorhabditis sp. 36 PRJEB53466]|nr:unnamed protein product [Caenorhabditis sp. 36 PRJEB53466]